MHAQSVWFTWGLLYAASELPVAITVDRLGLQDCAVAAGQGADGAVWRRCGLPELGERQVTVDAEDVLAAATMCIDLLEAVQELDWRVPVPGLEFTVAGVIAHAAIRPESPNRRNQLSLAQEPAERGAGVRGLHRECTQRPARFPSRRCSRPVGIRSHGMRRDACPYGRRGQRTRSPVWPGPRPGRPGSCTSVSVASVQLGSLADIVVGERSRRNPWEGLARKLEMALCPSRRLGWPASIWLGSSGRYVTSPFGHTATAVSSEVASAPRTHRSLLKAPTSIETRETDSRRSALSAPSGPIPSG